MTRVYITPQVAHFTATSAKSLYNVPSSFLPPICQEDITTGQVVLGLLFIPVLSFVAMMETRLKGATAKTQTNTGSDEGLQNTQTL